MRNKIWMIISIIFLLVISVTAIIYFQGKEREKKASLLLQRARTFAECDHPCENGIVPGETKVNEVSQILGRNSEIMNIDIGARVTGEKIITWEYRDKSVLNSGKILGTGEGIVEEVTIYPNPDEPLYLSDLLADMGKPDIIRPTGYHNISAYVELVYFKDGVGLDVKTDLGWFTNDFYIDGNKKVSQINFFEKSMDRYHERMARQNFNKYYQWNGYGWYPVPIYQ